ncbi:hypothetical protein Aduo_018558 [Ancylostoma duodenale]
MSFSPLRSSSVPVKQGRFDCFSPSHCDSIERLRIMAYNEPIPNFMKLIMEVLIETKKEVTAMNERGAELIRENTRSREENFSQKRTIENFLSSGSGSSPTDSVNKA